MPSLLLVCTANRIRSPLAQALLQQRLRILPDSQAWRVESAGVWTNNGLPATEEVQQVAGEHGFDLRSHRSRRVEDVDLTQYDLVLTMTGGQRDALRAETPQVASRIVTFTEVLVGVAYDIDDPVGRPLSAYRQTYDELVLLLDQGLLQLVERARRQAAQQAEGGT